VAALALLAVLVVAGRGTLPELVGWSGSYGASKGLRMLIGDARLTFAPATRRAAWSEPGAPTSPGSGCGPTTSAASRRSRARLDADGMGIPD
jgi:hypothetical protein